MTKRNLVLCFSALALTGIGVFGIVAISSFTAGNGEPVPYPEAPVGTQTNPLVGVSADQLPELIRNFDASEDAEERLVAQKARIKLAYHQARRDDIEAADQLFAEVETSDVAQSSVDLESGSLAEEAKYQRLVLLMMQDRNEEARSGFRKFIEENPHSAKITAAFRRLQRLSGGIPRQQDIDLYERALAVRQEHIRLEAAMCGPKAVALLASDLGKDLSYTEAAKVAQTDEFGTTPNGILSALASIGLSGSAYNLAARDIRTLPLPSILLIGNHYYVARSRTGDELLIVDPVNNQEQRLTISAFETKHLTVITTSTLEL